MSGCGYPYCGGNAPECRTCGNKRAEPAPAPADDVHSCSLYCERPTCIKAQRDQMRDSRGKPAPAWWYCATHGPAQPNAWGCPECVREMRAELASKAKPS
jgi:hypothetical protein